jgi:hypothetical protein
MSTEQAGIIRITVLNMLMGYWVQWLYTDQHMLSTTMI